VKEGSSWRVYGKGYQGGNLIVDESHPMDGALVVWSHSLWEPGFSNLVSLLYVGTFTFLNEAS